MTLVENSGTAMRSISPEPICDAFAEAAFNTANRYLHDVLVAFLR